MNVETLPETFESKDLFRNAEIHIQRRNYERAELFLSEALKIVSDHPIYLSFYGLCVAMRGEHVEGEEICRKAIRLAPSIPIAHVNLGRVILAGGNRQGAREQFMRAYEMDNTCSAAALELSSMGVRRPPVLSFLDRQHPLNVRLGKLRYRLQTRRHSKLKKR